MDRRKDFVFSTEGLLVTSNEPHLSLRELQVLRLAAEGQTAKAIALALHVSVSAVSLYMLHARQKLGARTKSEAIAILMDTGTTLLASANYVKTATSVDASRDNDALHDMLLISTRMRHVLENMLIEHAAGKSDRGDTIVWRELTEKFLVMAAGAFGYEMVKMQTTSGLPISTKENNT